MNSVHEGMQTLLNKTRTHRDVGTAFQKFHFLPPIHSSYFEVEVDKMGGAVEIRIPHRKCVSF